MDGCISRKYSLQVMAANDCWFVKLTPLIKSGGALSNLSPWQLEAIHFVLQMFVPEPSAKLLMLHSSCIPADTSNHSSASWSRGLPTWETPCLLPDRVSIALLGRWHHAWDTESGCPEERGRYSHLCKQCHGQQGIEIKDEQCLNTVV